MVGSHPMAVRSTLRPLEGISLFFMLAVLVGYVEVYGRVWSDEMASGRCLRL